MTSPTVSPLSANVTSWSAQVAAGLALLSAQSEGMRRYWVTLALASDLPQFRADLLEHLDAAGEDHGRVTSVDGRLQFTDGTTAGVTP